MNIGGLNNMNHLFPTKNPLLYSVVNFTVHQIVHTQRQKKQQSNKSDVILLGLYANLYVVPFGHCIHIDFFNKNSLADTIFQLDNISPITIVLRI